MEANAFLIWRVGAANGWDVSAQEIADESGLAVSTVRRICRDKGWDERLSCEKTGHADRYPVDVVMRSGERFA
jgi:hypothetical protein